MVPVTLLLRTAALGAAGCRDVRAVVVATGVHVDPAALGPLPSHVTAHRFVDQDAVLAASDAVISHGGSGTVLGALKQALPSVTMPMGADQQLNSDRLRALGLGCHWLQTPPRPRRSATPWTACLPTPPWRSYS